MSFDIRDISKQLESHMSGQPYEIVCSKCGMPLNFKTDVDSELDISVEVEPCMCTQEEV